jgi:hypothetical protein
VQFVSYIAHACASVVAAGGGYDAFCPFLFIHGREQIDRTANLECTYVLNVFEFDEHVGVKPLIEDRVADQGCRRQEGFDYLPGAFYIGHRDWRGR